METLLLRVLFLAALLGLLGSLATEETSAEGPALPIDPTLLSWSAGTGFTIPDPDIGEHPQPPLWSVPPSVADFLLAEILPPDPQQVAEKAPGQFTGGVRLLYEQVRLEADRLLFWQTPLDPALAEDAPVPRAWPQRAIFLPGEDGPEPDRVHIDSRYSKLENVPFTGLLRPRKITIDRVPPSEQSDAIYYHILLEDVGHFRGEVRMSGQRWRTITGFADHMLIVLRTRRIGADRLGEPQMQAFHLIAPEEDEGRVRLTIWDERPSRIDSRSISVFFSAQGTLASYQAGANATLRGLNPSLQPEDRAEYSISQDAEQEERKAQRRQSLPTEATKRQRSFP